MAKNTFNSKYGMQEIFNKIYDPDNNTLCTAGGWTSSGLKTTDVMVTTGKTTVHSIVITCNDAAPTAGTIDIYDNYAASGTKIFSWTVTTTAFTPVTVILDVMCSYGVYIDFTTTADVAVFVNYRQ
jgi:hypothetical protein